VQNYIVFSSRIVLVMENGQGLTSHNVSSWSQLGQNAQHLCLVSVSGLCVWVSSQSWRERSHNTVIIVLIVIITIPWQQQNYALNKYCSLLRLVNDLQCATCARTYNSANYTHCARYKFCIFCYDTTRCQHNVLMIHSRSIFYSAYKWLIINWCYTAHQRDATLNLPGN